MADLPPLPSGFTLDQPSGSDPFSRNQAYAKPAPAGGYLTRLPPQDEAKFQAWVKQNNVPFDPSPQADYDMRGFYKAMQAGDPRATTGVNQNDGKLHFGDYWKTPYHKSFSNESQWATADAPHWNEKDQLISPKGDVVFDERAQNQSQQALPPLPPGFTLDSAPDATAAPSVPTRTVPQEAGRQLALTGRDIIQGVAALPMMAMDTGVAARNLAEQGVRKYLPGVAGKIDQITGGGPGQPYEMPSQMFERSLDQYLPKPQTTTEKITHFIQTAMVGSRMPAPQAANQAPAGFTPANPEAAVRNTTLKQAQDAGYVVPPATSNPSALNRALEGASGKIATAQQAAVRNQAVTNKLTRQALGMANDAPITPDSLRSLRETAGQVYQQVASSGRIAADSQYLDDLGQLGRGVDEITKDFPDANVGARQEIDKLVNSLLRDSFDSSSAVKYLRQLRSDASANLTSAARNPDPAKQALGMAQREAASTLEDLIGRHLAQQGDGQLAQSFQQARRLIAVTHTVENALNESTGSVSAVKLAKELKGKPYGGELQIAAKFAQAFPKAAKEVTESMPGVSPLDYYGSIGAAGLFGSPHLLLLPAARMGIREALLSPWGQRAATETAKVAGKPAATMGATIGTALATSSAIRPEPRSREQRR